MKPIPTMTPRAVEIKTALLADASALIENGGVIHSRQIEALAAAVARHLAGLEAVIDQRSRWGRR